MHDLSLLFFLTMDSNFKILYAMVPIISQFLCLNVGDIASITNKNVDDNNYLTITHSNLLKSFVLKDCGYI